MKTRILIPCRQGFTLLEMLIVITMIAILSTLSYKGHGVLLNRTRGTQAHTECLALENALKDYYLQYGSFPVDSTSDGPFESKGDLMRILMGERLPNSKPFNRRGITFFGTSRITNDPKRPGFVVPLSQFNDPWGTPLHLHMDVQDTGAVTLPLAYQEAYGKRISGRQVLVVSAGADRDFDTIEDNISTIN